MGLTQAAALESTVLTKSNGIQGFMLSSESLVPPMPKLYFGEATVSAGLEPFGTSTQTMTVVQRTTPTTS